MKGWIIVALSFFMNVTPSSASATTGTTSIFNPVTTRLDNGLQVVLIENHLAPVVSISLVYKVGTADDPVGMAGLSHFVEHLMFKGTKDVPSDQFKKIISSKGGIINAYTTPDLTAYTCDIAVEFLDFYLKLEADRMQNLVMEPGEVKAEQKVVHEERRMRLENNPFGVAYEAGLRSTYWHHPYGKPAIGYPQDIAAYTSEAAYQHYKKWYAPNNAILIVAGDVSMETLKPLAEKYFGKIPALPLPPRERVKEPDHAGVTVNVEQESPRISQVNIGWSYAAPNHNSAHSEHYYPLIILAQALGGNAISRLYRTLVEEQALAVDADAAYDSDGLDPEIFSFSATLAPGQDLVSLKKAMEDHIMKVVDKGISEKELADAKRDILANLAFARDGNSTSVMTFTLMAIGFTVEQIEDWPRQINSVTLQQVHEAARAILFKSPVTLMTLYPLGYQKNHREAVHHMSVESSALRTQSDDPSLPHSSIPAVEQNSTFETHVTKGVKGHGP